MATPTKRSKSGTDFLVIGGIGAGLFLVLFGIVVMGAPLQIYLDPASVFITFGGAIASLVVATPGYYLKKIGKLLKIVTSTHEKDFEALIDILVTFSEKAKREGILSLEDDLEEIEDPFLKKGLQLVVDGVDPEIIKNILIKELEFIQLRHAEGIKIFQEWGYYLPAFGMIGTLIGLIFMLINIEDRSSIGKGMATALITTLYGAIAANLIALPMSTRLEYINNQEITEKEIIIEGILSIQAGENPMIAKEKLMGLLPQEVQKQIKERKEKAKEA